MPAKKMKAEARKIAVVVIDVSSKVGDVRAESDRRNCAAWDASTSD